MAIALEPVVELAAPEIGQLIADALAGLIGLGILERSAIQVGAQKTYHAAAQLTGTVESNVAALANVVAAEGEYVQSEIGQLAGSVAAASVGAAS